MYIAIASYKLKLKSKMKLTDPLMYHLHHVSQVSYLLTVLVYESRDN